MIAIRAKHSGEILCQVNADSLREADLSNRLLSDAYLTRADLTRVNLRNAILEKAHLNHAHVFEGNLSGADLSGADLRAIRLINTDLTGANLSDAVLTGANLTGTDLTDAVFSNAILSHTVIGHCDTLHKAKALDISSLTGQIIMDQYTVRANLHVLSNEFLKSVGYTLEDINRMRADRSDSSQFYTCFLSYAHADAEFANKLYGDLIANGVKCWRDIHDMRSGDFFRSQIQSAIACYDKVIVICSTTSLQRPNVIYEIVTTIERERELASLKLIPIRIDYAIFDEDLIKPAMASSTPWHRGEDWIQYLRAFHIPDFTRWRDDDSYLSELNKLLRSLRLPTSGI